MKKIILGFCGEMGCGKGTATKYLIDHYNAKMYKFSNPLRDIIKRLYQEETRQNLQKLSTSLRETFGQNILSEVIFRDLQNSNSEINIIDGIRRPSDIDFFKEQKNFILIYIETDMKIRYERIAKRGENADDLQKTWEEFKKDASQEAESQIKKLKPLAHYKIENNKTQKELENQIEEVMKKIKGH